MGHKAILHIYSTFNNVLITATDLTGAETVCKVSAPVRSVAVISTLLKVL